MGGILPPIESTSLTAEGATLEGPAGAGGDTTRSAADEAAGAGATAEAAGATAGGATEDDA